jgi:hypothetical protein
MTTRSRVAALAALLLLGMVAPPAGAAVVQYTNTQRDGSYVNLGTAQTGNADTTNTLDRGTLRRAGLLTITSTIGATPTVTVNILGSADGTTFYNIPYCLAATPETLTVAAITITTATTGHYVLRAEHPWRFLKVNFSANTNVTLTTDVAP